MSSKTTATDTTKITMMCPNLDCGRTVATSTAARGKVVRCPHCNVPFRVPTSGAAPAAAPAATPAKT